jgi:hypothetical protein
MTDRPVVGSLAEEVYPFVAPLARNDELLEWALLVYVAAITEMYQEAADFGRDSSGRPGWALLMDPDTCPEKALPWLAQFVGVGLRDISDPAEQRDKIKDQPARRRGTPQAMIQAVKATLTGTQVVILRERNDGTAVEAPYNMVLITFTSQTPHPAKTSAVAHAEKDAGLLLEVLVEDGQDWQLLIDENATWADVISTYSTWDDVILHTP